MNRPTKNQTKAIVYSCCYVALCRNVGGSEPLAGAWETTPCVMGLSRAALRGLVEGVACGSANGT